MKQSFGRWAGLTLTWLVGMVLLGACGEATVTSLPTTQAVALTIATTPSASATTVVATLANSPLASATSPITTQPPPTSMPNTQPATTNPPTAASVKTTLPPTPADFLPTQVAVGPTITAVPTPAAAPITATWVKNGVCYEVFVRSFFDSNGDGKGDLAGLIAKLDYLNDGNPNSTTSLGVNCIWLMPVAASPSYHGYDTTDYYKINPDYGTNDDFKRLMTEAHKRGIYVITDLVLNHTSAQSEWFKQAAADPKSPYRDWYIFSPSDPGYAGPWGAQAWWKNPAGSDFYYGVFDRDLPDLNYRNPAVTKQMYDVTRFWLQDMGADGFRLDAIKHLIENGKTQQNTPETRAWLRDFRKFYASIKPDTFTIGEINGQSFELNGYYPDQLDDYFEFSMAQNFVNSANNGEAAFVSPLRTVNNIWPLQRYGTFLTNHDQKRVMSVLSGDMGKMKMAATTYLTSPGLPFIYYGEEIGMQGDKPDPNIRTPMQWTSDPQGGFTTGTAWEALQPDTKTVNVQAQNSDPNSLLTVYRQLIRLRRTHPALAQGSFTPLSSSNGSVAAYLRHSEGEDVLVVINLGDQAVTDLKLSQSQTDLAAGSYQLTDLLVVNGPKPTLNSLTVGADGSIQTYTPLANLPGHSACIIGLKK